MALLSFLDRERIIAKPGFNRWLVPPAALAIHLCIGQAYAFSVFNKPLTKLVAVKPARADRHAARALAIEARRCAARGARPTGRFRRSDGSSASRSSFSDSPPRRSARGSIASGRARRCSRARCASAAASSSARSAFTTHQFWLLLLGYGVLGGIGLGLGYISPVSTLIKWFPDKPGMATGLAIMGFGGGAMIAAPLSVKLMDHFPRRCITALGVTGDVRHARCDLFRCT